MAAIACAPGKSELPGSPESPPVQQAAAAEVLTVRQVLVLAQTALNSAKSYRGRGETRIELDEQEPEVSTLTVEWASPDRLRQESRTADSNETRQESIESIRLEGEQYLRGSYLDGSVSTKAGWHQGPSYSGESNLVMSSLGITGPAITGTLSLNGRDVYRIEGSPNAMIDPVPAIGTLPLNGSFVLFVDMLNFRLVRIEQIAEVAEYRPRPGSGILPRFVLGADRLAFTATTTLDFEYFDEPLTIERPVVFPTPSRRRR